MEAYITDLASFLPNAPVENDDMEKVLGMVGRVPSRTRAVILRKNRIRQRYYAIDPATGSTTHTNARLTAEAIRALSPYPGYSPGDIEFLSCGTSSPDQLFPAHGLMVQGELAAAPCEVATSAGVCLSGISALKAAAFSVALGQSQNAAATGSELASTFMRSEMFLSASPDDPPAPGDSALPPFNADFLRWMLSDGAGAAFLEGAPRPDRIALRIDWIDQVSYANELETCMYLGGVKEAGGVRGWREFGSMEEAVSRNAFLVQQDVQLLNREVVRTAVDRALTRVIARRGIAAAQVDWFLPHYSSEFFRKPLSDRMAGIGFAVPEERWFTNLSTRGNTGSASIYIMMEELFHSGRLRRGEKLLCMIPESSRFSVAYMQLTVV